MPSIFDGKYIKLNQKRGKNINILRKIPFALNTLLHAAKKEKKVYQANYYKSKIVIVFRLQI